jgi:surface polysaccharide O-acyltransferase-like enzyme
MSTLDSTGIDHVAAPLKSAALRNSGLDALRASLTLLVVFHHCAITYGAIGGWYYHEVAPDKSLESMALVLFCTINQAFFMGLFFFLAGYYTSRSIDRKGIGRFLADRFLRLGVPLLMYGLLIGPVTIALAQTSHGHSFVGTLRYLWRNGTFENGPMWFAQALLIFSVIAALRISVLQRRADRRTGPDAIGSTLPSNLMLGSAAILTGIAALALRSAWPVGVNVWGLQLGYFASYIVLFAAGCGTARAHWIERLPRRQVRVWGCIALISLPVLPLVYFMGEHFPGLRGRPLSVVYAFWEPFVAWGTILVLLDGFQRHCHKLSGLWRPLSRRAYTIYIIHPPVLVAVALLWRNVPANPLLKFMATGSLSCVLCYVVAGLLLRLPGLATIL